MVYWVIALTKSSREPAAIVRKDQWPACGVGGYATRVHSGWEGKAPAVGGQVSEPSADYSRFLPAGFGSVQGGEQGHAGAVFHSPAELPDLPGQAESKE